MAQTIIAQKRRKSVTNKGLCEAVESVLCRLTWTSWDAWSFSHRFYSLCGEFCRWHERGSWSLPPILDSSSVVVVRKEHIRLIMERQRNRLPRFLKILGTVNKWIDFNDERRRENPRVCFYGWLPFWFELRLSAESCSNDASSLFARKTPLVMWRLRRLCDCGVVITLGCKGT